MYPVLPQSFRQRAVVFLRAVASVFALGLCLPCARSMELALERDFTVRQWHTQDGLPNEEITAIAQDPQGFLWVATNGGLVRFDGTQFRPVRFPSSESHLGNAVTAMHRLPGYGLVVAVASSGLYREQDGALVLDPRFGFVGRRTVIALFGEPGGALWIGCDDGVVFRCAENAAPEEFAVPRGLPGSRRIGFARDGRGRVWVTSDMTLLSYHAGRLETFAQDFKGEELRIGSSTSDSPWLLSETKLLRLAGARFEPLTAVASLFGAHYVQSMTEDREGLLWLATRSKGLLRYVNGVLSAAPQLGEDIFDLTIDASGQLWVAGNGSGLARLQRRSFQVFNRESGLDVDFSSSGSVDTQGRVWLANRDGGIVAWDGKAFVRHGPLPDWPTYSANTVFLLRDGRMAFTCGSGAYAIAGLGGPITKIASVPQSPTIRRVFATKSGERWMSVGADEIARLSDVELTRWPAAKVPAGAEVRALGEDSAGRLLVGTSQSGLWRWAGDRLVPFEPAPPKGVGAIQCIFTAADGRLWLGTERGVATTNKAGAWVILDHHHGLTHSNVTQILADDAGRWWFGTGGGIFAINASSLDACVENRSEKVHPLVLGGDESGRPLTCIAPYQPAAWRTTDGRLWFSTRRGVVAFDPEREFAPLPVPRVSITAVSVDGAESSPSAALRASAGAGRLEFGFSALCLAAPERVRIRYRLEGFDGDWLEAGSARVSAYPRLPPGDYTFRVMASLPERAEVSETALKVEIQPLWWQTIFFRWALVVVATASVVMASRAWSTHRLRSKLEKMERESELERERARIARDIHDDLGASLTRISLLTQSGTPDGSVAPVRMGQIYETVSQITRSMDEIVWAIDPRHDNLDALAGYLASYAQSFLAAAGIRCRLDLPTALPMRSVTSQTRHHLFLSLKEALNNVVRHSGAGEVTLGLSVNEKGFALQVRDDGRGLASGGATDTHGSRDRLAAGNGLRNMRARLESLGGQCVMDSTAQSGVTITFSVPNDSPRPVT